MGKSREGGKFDMRECPWRASSGNVDLEPASEGPAAHSNYFALCREIIPDDRMDCDDTRASADGSRCRGAFQHGRRVCEAKASS